MNCISIDQLLAFAQNHLPGDEAERVRVHLDAGCVICRKQVDQLQKILAATAKEPWLEAPQWLTQQAINLFARHHVTAGEPRIERLPAWLVSDSFADGRLLGFRGAGPQSRQMLYRAGQYDIDLSLDYVEPTRAIDLMGQTLPLGGDLQEVAGADVRLLNPFLVASTRTNEYGEFIIEGLADGRYDLQIQLNGQQIDIAGLNTSW